MSIRTLVFLSLLLVLAACPATGVFADEAGEAGYELRCLVCHGEAGQGIDGLGANLVTSEFVRARSLEQLVEFLKVGRLPNDPDTVSGRPMPGFAWIDEAQLAAIAAYVKSLSRG